MLFYMARGMFNRFATLFRYFVFGIILLSVFLVTINNRDDVTLQVSPFPYELTLPAYLMILLTFVSGYAVGGGAGLLKGWHSARLLKREHDRNTALQNELNALKAEQRMALETDVTVSATLPNSAVQ